MQVDVGGGSGDGELTLSNNVLNSNVTKAFLFLSVLSFLLFLLCTK
jgi:hypothetical protein